jgi:Tol biopolymer transport system component
MRSGFLSTARRAAPAALAAVFLAIAAAPPARAAFPGRNGRIAFWDTCHPDGSAWCVFTMNPDGRDRRRLVRGSTPAYAPASDGRIAFATEDGLGVAAADGTGAQARFVKYEFHPDGLAFAPDGRRLAYTEDAFSPLTIVRLDDPQAPPTTLPARLRLMDPAWSKRGGLAFTRLIQSENYDFCANEVIDPELTDIATVSPTGSGLKRVTRVYGARDPNWSPDGRRLVFVRDLGLSRKDLVKPDARASDCLRPLSGGAPRASTAGAQPRGVGMYVVDADGRHARRVLATKPSSRLGYERPVWSPDGTKIAFERGNGLYVVNVDGGGARLIARGARDPDWQALPRR